MILYLTTIKDNAIVHISPSLENFPRVYPSLPRCLHPSINSQTLTAMRFMQTKVRDVDPCIRPSFLPTFIHSSHRLMTRCLDKSCEIIKWLTSSSAQYERWLAMLAQREMSRRPLRQDGNVSVSTGKGNSHTEKIRETKWISGKSQTHSCTL